MVSDKGSGERHRHECPTCGVAVQCADRAPHRVGYPPTIRLSRDEEWEQRFKVCEECARRESKGMKSSVSGDVAILAQLLERGLPPRNPVDVLAEAYVTRARPHADAMRKELAREFDRTKSALDQMLGALYGRTKKEARRLALFAYLEMAREDRDAALTVMRRYPKAAFPSVRAFRQAAYRLRKKLSR
jgi:hypothetical protein